MSSGIQLVVPGLSFDVSPVRYIPPIPSGLEYMNFFTDGSEITRNLAPNKGSTTVVGNPTIVGNALETTMGVNFLSTTIQDSSELTVVVVAKPDPDFVGAQMLVSNFGSSAGFTTRFNTNTVPFVNNSVVSSTNTGNKESTRLGTVPITSPRIIVAGRSFLAGTQTITDAGGTTTTSLVGSTPVYGLTGVRIGSTNSATVYSNVTQIYAAAVFSRYLTTQEISDIIAYLKSYYTAKGIVVDA